MKYEKIIQIMPAAEGWRALYVERDEDDGGVMLHSVPLAGWALVEWPASDPNDEPTRSMEGMDGTGGWVAPCREARNFVRYLAPDETEEAMRDEAEAHLTRSEEAWRRKWAS